MFLDQTQARPFTRPNVQRQAGYLWIPLSKLLARMDK